MKKQKKPLLSFIIPVYNEEKTFAKMFARLDKVELPGVDREYIIVEAQSTDKSPQILDTYAKHKDVRVFHLKKYCGKGTKVRYGFSKAKGDIIAIQDADMEYDPKDYPELLAPILAGKADFVLGSRHLGKSTWKIRQFDYTKFYARFIDVASIGLYAFFAVLYGTYLTDPQTMYKIFRKKCIQEIKFNSDLFDLDWEIVTRLVKRGHVPLEVPVNYKARSLEEGKKVRIVRDGFRAVWTILKYRFVG